MTKTVHVYHHSPASVGPRILWSQSAINPDDISIPRLIDTHFAKYREEYLEFIYRLGQSKIENETVIDYFKIKKVSMWWMSLLSEKCEFKTPELYWIMKLRCFEELITAKSHYIFHGFDQKHTLCLKQICDSVGATYKFSDLREEQKTFSSFIPPWGRALFFLGKWFLKRWLPIKIGRPNWKTYITKSKPLVLSYMPLLDKKKAEVDHQFYSHYWNVLHDHLKNKKIDCHWVWFFQATEKNFPYYIGLSKELNKHDPQNPVFFTEDFIDLKAFFNIFLNYFKIFFRYSKLGKISKEFHLKNSNFNFYHLFSNSIDASFAGNTFVSSLIFLEAFDKMIQEIPKNLGLYLWENQPWEMGLISLWEQHHSNIPLYGYQHTTLLPTDFRNFCHPLEFKQNDTHPIPTKILVNNDYSKKQLVESGYPSDRISFAESFRYDFLRNKYGLFQDKTFKGNILTVLGCSYADNYEQLKLIHDYRKKHPHINFILKPHPFHSAEKLIQDFSLTDLQIVTGTMEEALQMVEMVFCSHTTTTVIEVAWLGLPQLIGPPKDGLNNCLFFGMENIPFIHSLEQFEYYIKHPTKVPIAEDFYKLNNDFHLIDQFLKGSGN